MGSGVLSKVARRLVNRAGPRWVDEMLGALWPPRCVLCGGAAEPDNLCSGCRADLPWQRTGCLRCAEPLPGVVQACGACIRQPPPFEATAAALAYRPPITTLVQRFKYRADLAAGRALAAAMAERARRADRPQLLVPVPLHWTRQLKRGFNQAELLALDLAASGGPPVHGLLRRARRTPAQSNLAAGRRRANVRGAFQCRPLPPGLRHVALVDDVMTTGATLAECARTLKRAGVQRVDVWVAARA